MWKLYVTFLILGFTTGVYMETCPPVEDIRPCNCKEKCGDIDVECKGPIDLEMLRKSLNNFSGKNIADLMLIDIKIGTLSTNLFNGIVIQKLSLHVCPLDNLTTDDQPALLGLENHLEVLSIYKGLLKETKSTKFNLSHMKKMKILDIAYNYGIKEIGDDWFSNGPFSLESLYISANGIKRIGSNAFANLSNLKELSLSGNRFGPIKRSMLPTRADRLERLHFTNNHWTDLPENIFSKMPSVIHITLDMNPFSTLDKNTWSPIWQQLEQLDLRWTEIHCDDRLKWISKMQKGSFIVGLCHQRMEFKGSDIRDIIRTLN